MYEKNTDCVDDFWQQVAKFVCCIAPKGVSNLLFSQVFTLHRDKQ